MQDHHQRHTARRCGVRPVVDEVSRTKIASLLRLISDLQELCRKLREIWKAPDRAAAETAVATFADKYGAKYEKAVTCLVKDRERLLTFYDFPAEHWDHLRTSNPIKSVFAAVRHRTVRTKGALLQDTAKPMVFKLVTAAAKTWHRLKGENQLPKLIEGIKFINARIERTSLGVHARRRSAANRSPRPHKARPNSCWPAPARDRAVSAAAAVVP